MSHDPKLRDQLRLYMKFHVLDNRRLAKLAGVAENTVSRILNDDEYVASPETLEKFATKAFGLKSAKELWLNPFEKRTPETASVPAPEEPFDLEIWLNDPHATIHGKPATKEQRALVQQMVEFLKAGGGL